MDISGVQQNGRNTQKRIYQISESIIFCKTDEPFGGLSNMAAGYSIMVNGIKILTSEALYQACRFPALPDVQQLIIDQRSPMTAKMKSKPHRKQTRLDWEQNKVKIMRWCLHVKLAQNYDKFSRLLLETGDKPIVELSRKDALWGAKNENNGTLVGMNVLGRLLMELREKIKSYSAKNQSELLLSVEPLDIPDFNILGKKIEPVTPTNKVREKEKAPNNKTKETSVTMPMISTRSLFEEDEGKYNPHIKGATRKSEKK